VSSPGRVEGEEVRSLSVVIPVYNSEETIGPLVDQVVEHLSSRFERLEVVLVNDGSQDASDARAIEAQARHPAIVKYVRLARNFGEHNAVMCGLHQVTCDAAVIIDDDFQNPPEEIIKLVEKLGEGHDVVYSYYAHKQHHWFRNLGSRFNDRVASALLKKPRGLYLSSFKAMNRFLVKTIIGYSGPYPYIDGLILRATRSIGRQLCEHSSREVGHSNYSLRMLVRLWLNMCTSSSLLPLRLASIMGFAASFTGVALAVFFVFSYFQGGVLFQREVPPGWASLIVAVTLFSGVQLTVLGMIGEYLGRLFLTQNLTPQFVVRRKYGDFSEPTDDRTE
jgi:undecaprenyl-phosphate 4-deoxy-4-formamido-L-arabinose transferase